jgi:hypothetical protein
LALSGLQAGKLPGAVNMGVGYTTFREDKKDLKASLQNIASAPEIFILERS